MRTSSLLALVLVFVASCTKDSTSEPARQAAVDPKPAAAAPPVAEMAAAAEVSPEQVAQLLEQHAAAVVDANTVTTREKHGVIPGAILLSSHDAYEVSALPTDTNRPLVFYCANERCGASHVAAKRAKDAGYSQVSVMPAGIAGWAKAGNPVTQL
jgi:rhodanese-related sulfurtransferase